MSKIALYRKYRPNDFRDVYGQEIIVKTLINSIKLNSINHAYIFSGPRGSGKTSMAKIFARAINCNHLDNDFSICKNCEHCKNMIDGNSLDIIELDAASNNGINEIRNVINSVSFMPSNLKYKVYIIDEAHMLTTNSWNALLKTIEEPPVYVVFIFATTEFNKIPATIISRCQRFDFTRLPNNLLGQLLSHICKEENIKIDYEALNTIVNLADGAARDAITILDQMTTLSNTIEKNNVNDIFGLINLEQKIELLNYIFTNDLENIIIFLNDQYQRGSNFTTLIADLIKMLFDKILYMETNNLLFCKMLNESTINAINVNDSSKIMNLLNHFNKSLNTISKSKDQLFETQMVMISALSIIEQKLVNNDNQSNNVFKQKNELNNLTAPIVKSEDQTSMFDTKIKLIYKPISLSKKQHSFVPLKPEIQKIKKQEPQVDQLSSSNPSSASKLKLIIDNTKLEEFFFKVAANNNKEIKDDLNLIFEELASNRIFETSLINKMLVAKKFLLVSKNGAVLLFENAKQASNFNEVAKDKELQKWIQENLKIKNVIYGIDKESAKIFIQKFKEDERKNLPDVEPNNEIENTKTLILDILHSE